MDRQQAAFVALYPHAQIHVVTGSSREAVGALFGAQCDLAVVARPLRSEERLAAARGGLNLLGYSFAKDAVAVVVHASNEVENLALDELRGIYEGRIQRWTELGGSDGEIEPVFPAAESDLAEFFVHQVMDGQPVRARAIQATSDSGVVATVRSRPNAIGFVSLASSQAGVSTLRLSSLSGLPYWKPDLEAVHRGEYPLTRFLSLYVRASGAQLAHGLVTFATSNAGQKIVRDAGLLPTTVPVRFVRRSPLRRAH